MVGAETDAVSVFSTTQFSIGQAFLEDDMSFSKELDDLGSSHVVSIDATCSTADRLTGTSFGSASVQTRTTKGTPLNVTVEVGDWEHECCGPAIERNDVVDLGCLRWRDADGQVRLIETHHDSPIETRVRGRVVDIVVLAEDGSSTQILRVPSGAALRGFDEEDDGHLETPWSGELVDGRNRRFRVTVKP